jgi:hypothetical protein
MVRSTPGVVSADREWVLEGLPSLPRLLLLAPDRMSTGRIAYPGSVPFAAALAVEKILSPSEVLSTYAPLSLESPDRNNLLWVLARLACSRSGSATAAHDLVEECMGRFLPTAPSTVLAGRTQADNLSDLLSRVEVSDSLHNPADYALVSGALRWLWTHPEHLGTPIRSIEIPLQVRSGERDRFSLLADLFWQVFAEQEVRWAILDMETEPPRELRDARKWVKDCFRRTMELDPRHVLRRTLRNAHEKMNSYHRSCLDLACKNYHGCGIEELAARVQVQRALQPDISSQEPHPEILL